VETFSFDAPIDQKGARTLAETIRGVRGVADVKVCRDDNKVFVGLDQEHPATSDAIVAAAAAGGGTHLRHEPVGCKLTPPRDGSIPVAVVLSPDAEVVDFSGPWGVFEYANVAGHDTPPFHLYTVGETAAPIKCSGGMTIVPDCTFADAPRPKIIVIPAIGEPSPALLSWVRDASKSADLTMSVCNGSFVLAKAGLLTGKTVTSHHGGYGQLAAMFPGVTVKRGARFVDDANISTAGGLTSGIDLALHVVERYFGRDAAEQTARDLEYQGQGWKDPNSNSAFVSRPISTDDKPVCPVCEMMVARGDAITETYQGRTIYFCSGDCKKLFDSRPDLFTAR
jgi:transcriptional regulator GlxA family with amidase domain